MDPIKDEDEDAYRDSLFGKNREQANPNKVSSTIFLKKRPISGDYIATTSTAERTPKTGMGTANFESQANAATKGNQKILFSIDSIMTDESLKSGSEKSKRKTDIEVEDMEQA